MGSNDLGSSIFSYIRRLGQFRLMPMVLIPPAKVLSSSLKRLVGVESSKLFTIPQQYLKKTRPKTQRPLTKDFHAPRNPVVLCHGLFGFDKLGPSFIPILQIEYWGTVKQVLERIGVKVCIPGVSRANELNAFINTVSPGKLVNLLGHSMFRVQSLSTVGTPHRGSPFMDWCRDYMGLARNDLDLRVPTTPHSSQKGIAPIVQDLVDRIRTNFPWLIRVLDMPAYSNLTTRFLQRTFNPLTPDDPAVHYYSYAAQIDYLPLVHPLRIPWEIVTEREGKNDGLVSVQSASWGKLMPIIDQANHWEMSGRSSKWKLTELPWATPRSFFDPSEFYLGIADTLWKEGC